MSELNIRRDVDLTKLTTFGFTQRARHYVEVRTDEELDQAVQLANHENWPLLPLGSGSNVVLTRDFPGLVIRHTGKAIAYERNADSCAETGAVHVTASAGVNWHDLVLDTVERGLAGLENLSLIPGQVGAAPVQNIGAYGVELCDRFVSLRALHMPSGRWKTFHPADCRFSYRDSYFKHTDGQHYITQVTLQVSGHAGLHTGYEPLSQYLAKHYPGQEPTAKLVSQAVCNIRSSKLPDPARLPNAGSFFHNPLVSRAHFQYLQKHYPEIVAYPVTDDQYKLAAGWLIDQLGYKGYRKDGVGVHDKQALVLIRYGQADASQLLHLANTIRDHVTKVFGVTLDIEPRLV